MSEWPGEPIGEKHKMVENTESTTAAEETPTETWVSDGTLTVRGVWRNLIFVSGSFMLLICSFNTLQALQSTINRSEGLGTTSLSALYVAAILSALFLSSTVLSGVGCKWTMVISMLAYMTFVGANFYPTWGTILPTSILLGLGASCLWAAQMSYVSQLGDRYARLTGIAEKTVMNRFSGVFGAIVMTSNIFGNLCSSLVLGVEGLEEEAVGDEITLCGSKYCPASGINITTLQHQESDKKWILTGILAGLGGLGVLLMGVAVDNIRTDGQRTGRKVISLGKCLDTVRHIWRSRYQKLLIPVTIYKGMQQAFFAGDLTVAFISCPFGVGGVGFVILTNAVASSVLSILLGYLAKVTGHAAIFAMGLVAQGGVLVALLAWTPQHYYILIGLSAVWAIGTVVFHFILYALYSIVFTEDKEAAFSSSVMFEFIGFAVAFGYSGYLCTDQKIFITLAVLVCGAVLAIVVSILAQLKRAGK